MEKHAAHAAFLRTATVVPVLKARLVNLTLPTIAGNVRAAALRFDINPFPLHLTALNLAARYIRAPSTEMNTIHTDFFRVKAGQTVFSPHVVKTLARAD